MMGDDNPFVPERIIQRLQSRLQARADAEFQVWFKDYLKNVIDVRGVRMQEVRFIVHQWNQEWTMEQQEIPHETQTTVALQLMTSPFIEDKFASIIYMSEVLVANERYSINNFDSFESLFSLGHINNFKVCDHFSQKVLIPLVTQVGAAVASRLQQWFDSPNIYQARAALGALLSFSADALYQDAIIEGATKLLRRREEDCKSIAGSALRALGKHRPEMVDAFLTDDSNLANNNAASLLKATANLTNSRTRFFRQRRRQLLQTLAQTQQAAGGRGTGQTGQAGQAGSQGTGHAGVPSQQGALTEHAEVQQVGAPLGHEAEMLEGAILEPQMLEGGLQHEHFTESQFAESLSQEVAAQQSQFSLGQFPQGQYAQGQFAQGQFQQAQYQESQPQSQAQSFGFGEPQAGNVEAVGAGEEEGGGNDSDRDSMESEYPEGGGPEGSQQQRGEESAYNE